MRPRFYTRWRRRSDSNRPAGERRLRLTRRRLLAPCRAGASTPIMPTVFLPGSLPFRRGIGGHQVGGGTESMRATVTR